MQVPRQEDLILEMVARSVSDLRKHRRRRFEWIACLEVDEIFLWKLTRLQNNISS